MYNAVVEGTLTVSDLLPGARSLITMSPAHTVSAGQSLAPPSRDAHERTTSGGSEQPSSSSDSEQCPATAMASPPPAFCPGTDDSEGSPFGRDQSTAAPEVRSAGPAQLRRRAGAGNSATRPARPPQPARSARRAPPVNGRDVRQRHTETASAVDFLRKAARAEALRDELDLLCTSTLIEACVHLTQLADDNHRAMLEMVSIAGGSLDGIARSTLLQSSLDKLQAVLNNTQVHRDTSDEDSP